ncbi:MAG: hypothetical protein ACI8X3_002908, partial [Saprospiraceae bacterium]
SYIQYMSRELCKRLDPQVVDFLELGVLTIPRTQGC